MEHTSGFGIQTLIFVVVAGGAFALSGLKFKDLFKMLKAHQGKPRDFSDTPARIQTVIANVFFQKAILRKKDIGIAHALIFWGFLVVTVGTIEQFISTIYGGFSFAFIGDEAYRTFLYAHDVFTFLVLVGVGYASIRRYIIKPHYLGKSKDADIVLVFTASLMISIFLMHGFLLSGSHSEYLDVMPFSALVSGPISTMGFSPEMMDMLGIAFKWVHMVLVLGFAVYIPRSKHLHIVAAGPNTFLRTLPREKGMRAINFEDEKVTQYGAAKVTDLSWKDALDYYSCTECGRCQELCPAFNTGKALSPKKLIVDLKDNMYRNKAAIIAGKFEEITPAIDTKVTEDVIWACTSCRACEVACPVFIEHTDKIYEIRRNLVMMESKFPAEVQPVFKNMETNATPWAFASSERANWAQGLEVKTMAEDSQVDYLLWVGCAGSFDDRNKKVMKAVVNVLKKAGVKFSILGNEEQCTGDPARRIGNEYLYQTLAKANVETLNRYNVKKIVTACPHCFNTIKNEYKDFGGNYEVIHHTQLMAGLIKEGKIKPKTEIKEKIAYHDSCYMGRWNNEYEAPRGLLSAIPGTDLKEMKNNKDASLCCGAGGGRMFMEEHTGTRINIKRTEQALETGSSVIAANCPFCMTMLNDGVKSKEMQDKVKVMDVAELIEQSL